MRQANAALTVATVAALAVGVTTGGGTHQSDRAPPSKSDILIVQNDAQNAPGTEASTDESAKTGKEEGTHTGSTMGATKENDTDKVDQPERSNPTTGAGDADTPEE